MPSYKAPVDDVMFLLSDVFHIDRYDNLPGFADATPDLVEAVLAEAAKFCRRGAHAAQPRRRQGRLPPPRRRRVTTPTGFKDAYQQAHRRRLDRHLGARRIRRPGPADGAGAGRQRVSLLGEHGLRHVSGPHPGRHRGAVAARVGGAEGALPAQAHRRAMGRHHEPDRAAMRHRSRSGAHPRRRRRPTAATGSPAPRSSSPPASTISPRTSFISCWRASTARRQGTRGISLFIVPKFLPDADGDARRAQRGVLRLDRGEDGHPRQRHLRDELRRRHRLADGRSQPRPAGDVHDDERGAARRRRAGPGAVRGRLSERRRLRQGAARRPRLDRREISATSPPIRSSCIRTCAAC